MLAYWSVYYSKNINESLDWNLCGSLSDFQVSKNRLINVSRDCVGSAT